MTEPRSGAGGIVLQGIIDDLGNAGDSALFAAPEAGYIKKIQVVRSAAGGSGASILTLTTEAGAVGATLTMLTAGAAGDVDELDLSPVEPNNYVGTGEGFSIATGGEFAGTPQGDVTVLMEPY